MNENQTQIASKTRDLLEIDSKSVQCSTVLEKRKKTDWELDKVNIYSKLQVSVKDSLQRIQLP